MTGFTRCEANVVNKGYLNSDRTIEGDECYTPYYAVLPLLEFAPRGGVIWCPFDKEWSAFVKVFTEHGFHVVYSHIDDGKDFFTYEPDHWDILISNPPFSKKDEVLKRACELGKPFALLLPANSIQGKKRFEIFNNNIQILSFDGRIDFFTHSDFSAPAKGVAFASSYFCRYLLPSKLELRKLNKDNCPLKV